MVYQWKLNTYSVPAQVVGRVCEQLEQTGGLTPARLVNVSRNEDAPLHPLFEWRDDVAAEKYREVQAAKIIRSITVETEKGEAVRAFVRVAEKNKTYTNIETAIRVSNCRAELLKQAKREMLCFIAKYKTLTDLTAVVDAMEYTIPDIEEVVNE